MKNILLIFLTTILLSGSCKGPGKDKNNQESNDLGSVLHLEMEEGQGQFLRLQKLSSEGFQTIDSLFLDGEGKGLFQFATVKPDFFAIRNSGNNVISFMSYGGETIYLRAKYTDFRFYHFSGSDEFLQLNILNSETQAFISFLDEIAQITRDSINHPDYTRIKLRLDQEYKLGYSQFKDFSTRFIRQNKGRLVSLLALTNQLGSNFYVFHPIRDSSIFFETDSILYSLYPECEPVKSLHLRVNEVRTQMMFSARTATSMQIGDKMPEVTLPDPDGKMISLSSLKGKTILVDFWASWCPPCRKQNPFLASLYEKYHKHGFDIFQVSLDKNREDWVRAIEQDKLQWKHVSDLKYWDSEVVKTFGISGIPFCFLVSEEGKIIDINPPLQSVEQKLSEILKL